MPGPHPHVTVGQCKTGIILSLGAVLEVPGGSVVVEHVGAPHSLPVVRGGGHNST
ncbi:MAG: hypothetical protein ACETWM_01310 [Candidatus Lokiarchaeia archaeon]